MTRGYGQILYNGKDTGAHRVSLILTGRPIPPGYDVMHICDNKTCVNPAHLRAVLHKANMADFAQKQLLNSPALTACDGDSEVLKAFKTLVLNLGGIPHAAKRFNVTKGCIYQKLCGWSQITGDMLAAVGYERVVSYKKLDPPAKLKRKQRRVE